MSNPFSTFQGFAGKFTQFMSNPAQFLIQCNLNIPQQYMSDTNTAIEYLMNTGKIDQRTYNYLNGIAGQIQNSPVFQQFINKH